MGAQNNFKGKYHEGTFANGEGPRKGLEIKKDSENTGVLNPPTSGRHLSKTSGSNDGLMGRSEDKAFDLYAKPYAGPGNLAFKPKDMGEVSNQPSGK